MGNSIWVLRGGVGKPTPLRTTHLTVHIVLAGQEVFSKTVGPVRVGVHTALAVAGTQVGAANVGIRMRHGDRERRKEKLTLSL